MEDLKAQYGLLKQRCQSNEAFIRERDELKKLYIVVRQLQRERWPYESTAALRRAWKNALNELGKSRPDLKEVSLTYGAFVDGWPKSWGVIVAAKIRRDFESLEKFVVAHDNLKKKYGVSTRQCSCVLCGGDVTSYLSSGYRIEDFRLSRIDNPLVPFGEPGSWRHHPMFSPAEFEVFGIILIFFVLLVEGAIFQSNTADPSFIWNWAHTLCGLLFGLSVASVAVVGLASRQAGTKLLELCRDSGVRWFSPRPILPWVETFMIVVFMGLALLCWRWQILLLGFMLGGSVLWCCRRSIYSIVRNAHELNDTIAGLGTVGNWPTYEQMLLSDDATDAKDEGAGKDFIVTMPE